MMEQYAVLSHYANEVMATRFSDVMWLMEQILWKSFDKRLGNPRGVVSRMLRYFQGEGTVRLARGTIEIPDRKKLERLRSG